MVDVKFPIGHSTFKTKWTVALRLIVPMGIINYQFKNFN
jgi:hypothetical protein